MSFEACERLPAPSSSPPAEKSFPGKLCFLAISIMAGFYYYLIFVVSVPGADDSGLPARTVLALSNLAVSHPALLGLCLLSTLVPTLVNPLKAPSYLARVAVLFGVLWLGIFTFSSHPSYHAASLVRNFLAAQRYFPETIHGR